MARSTAPGCVGAARSTHRGFALARGLLCLVLLVGLGTAHAQASACAGLDAPFPDHVHEFARGVIELTHEENRPGHVREYVPLQGWPTATRGTWEFQYPPSWTLRDTGIPHAWVSDVRDVRDASHVLFVLQDTTQGNPTVEALLYDLLNATIGPHTPCDRVASVASDATRRWFMGERPDDVGMVYAWVFRWIDMPDGPMIASLKLDIQARGMYTAYGYVFTSAPEAELATVVRDAFAPIAATFRGALSGTEREGEPKRKRNGDDEEDDRGLRQVHRLRHGPSAAEEEHRRPVLGITRRGIHVRHASNTARSTTGRAARRSNPAHDRQGTTAKESSGVASGSGGQPPPFGP